MSFLYLSDHFHSLFRIIETYASIFKKTVVILFRRDRHISIDSLQEYPNYLFSGSYVIIELNIHNAICYRINKKLVSAGERQITLDLNKEVKHLTIKVIGLFESKSYNLSINPTHQFNSTNFKEIKVDNFQKNFISRSVAIINKPQIINEKKPIFKFQNPKISRLNFGIKTTSINFLKNNLRIIPSKKSI